MYWKKRKGRSEQHAAIAESLHIYFKLQVIGKGGLDM